MKQRDFRLSRQPRMRLREFAKAVGVHLVTASIWENGRALPSPRHMARIEKVTGGKVRPNDYYTDLVSLLAPENDELVDPSNNDERIAS